MMSDWISVKDRMPTKHVKVIVAVKTFFGYSICMASFCGDGIWEESTFFETYGEMRFDENEPVIAWMPLPHPPIDPETLRPTAEWGDDKNSPFYVCSACRSPSFTRSKFCKECGAKMVNPKSYEKVTQQRMVNADAN